MIKPIKKISQYRRRSSSVTSDVRKDEEDKPTSHDRRRSWFTNIAQKDEEDEAAAQHSRRSSWATNVTEKRHNDSSVLSPESKSQARSRRMSDIANIWDNDSPQPEKDQKSQIDDEISSFLNSSHRPKAGRRLSGMMMKFI
mmetsp:Transcript_9309/g.17453  ORF Transcript_9309/g.17453 Transcript_9309/m.17453 type:complete len:141 (-) Transcript_9309:155-577(-)